MKVAFIPSYVSGLMWYRVYQPYLAMKRLFKRDKFVVTWYTPDQLIMHPWEADMEDPERFKVIYPQIDAACRWADVVVWMGLHYQRALDTFVHMRAKHGKKFVTEVDDYIFSIPPTNSAFQSMKPGTGYTHVALEQIKRSDALIVSTPHLKELYEPFCKQIHTVENAVSLPLWRRAASPARRRGLTIGWMGGGTHNEDHEMIQGAVKEVLEKAPKTRFTYISGCHQPRCFDGVERLKWVHDFKPIDKYPQWIAKQGFDIGIAPLVDNEFNRGKSNLRWLEYSAMGIPTVASNVLHFSQSIKHGKTGLLAGTHAEWVSSLMKLINEPDVRENIGKAARLEVGTKWSPEVQARKYRRALGEIANAFTDTP